jgi:hypothetical protein
VCSGGIRGRTLTDPRGTAVTRLSVADGTEAESASVTGRSMRGVRSILDRRYLHRDPR